MGYDLRDTNVRRSRTEEAYEAVTFSERTLVVVRSEKKKKGVGRKTDQDREKRWLLSVNSCLTYLL
jgi:hypothetical protein